MLSEEEKKLVNKKIELLSKRSKDEVRDIFEALVTQCILDSSDGKNSYIPLIGSFHFEQGIDGGIGVTFEIDEFLKKVLRQVYNGEETEVEKKIKDKIRLQLQKYTG